MIKKLLLFGVLIGILAGVYWLVDYLALNQSRLKSGVRQIIIQEGEETEPEAELVKYELEIVAQDLYVPWSIVFSSPKRILVSERSGIIRQIIDGKLQPSPLVQFNEVAAQSEAGLMGMALDPNYEENSFLYACLAYQKENKLANKIVRLIDKQDQILVDKTIIDNIPAAQLHAGCRVKFGPDQKLYITTGDATQKELAQNLDSLAGKILRIDPDGSIPEDNPFPNSPIYSYGHRNPQGLAWQPESGLLWETEHGPSGFDGPGGGDEINIIKPGGNYGWPLVSHEKNQEGLVAPKLIFTPAEAPASAMFYQGDVFPQFKNNFFFGALRGEDMIRLILDNEDQEKILSNEKLGLDVGRIRDVVEGPDGLIYFSTSNQDGRGRARENDDKIYRLKPVSSVSTNSRLLTVN